MLDRTDPDRRIWECMACGELNVWNWDDQERLEERGIKAHVAHGSCFDNVCGACGANIVAADSPILHPCYTHVEN